MILVGQYDSPYVRRVAVSLRVLGFRYEHGTRSVLSDFDAMRALNPLGRIPSLVLDDGEVLIDSAAILDWLDQTVGPARTLLPAQGPERRPALGKIALATGAIDKIGAAAYERLIRPATLRWPSGTNLDQAEITTACMLRYIQLADSFLLPPGRFPTLDALATRCEALPAFQATWPAEYVLPRTT
jgi:glutathione S-transferase